MYVCTAELSYPLATIVIVITNHMYQALILPLSNCAS